MASSRRAGLSRVGSILQDLSPQSKTSDQRPDERAVSEQGGQRGERASPVEMTPFSQVLDVAFPGRPASRCASRVSSESSQASGLVEGRPNSPGSSPPTPNERPAPRRVSGQRARRAARGADLACEDAPFFPDPRRRPLRTERRPLLSRAVRRSDSSQAKRLGRRAHQLPRYLSSILNEGGRSRPASERRGRRRPVRADHAPERERCLPKLTPTSRASTSLTQNTASRCASRVSSERSQASGWVRARPNSQDPYSQSPTRAGLERRRGRP
jgi:hypothetical protein